MATLSPRPKRHLQIYRPPPRRFYHRFRPPSIRITAGGFAVALVVIRIISEFYRRHAGG